MTFRLLELMTNHLPARLRPLTLIAHAILHRHPHITESHLDDCLRCCDDMR